MIVNRLKGGKLEKKVAIITGASSGIGKATFNFLKEKGYTCYNISRKPVDDKFSFSADVNDFEKIKTILEDIHKKEGRIDVFINNAGYGIAGAIESTKPENIYGIFDTNLSAVVTLCSLVIPYLKETKGRIVNISSVGGVVPLPYQACYSAAKAGILIFSKALNMEVKKFGVRVIAILPGDTKTGFTDARVIDKSDQSSKSIEKAEKCERKGKEPIVVAKVIYKVLKAKRPPLQKTVGFSYKTVVFLVKHLPNGMVNGLVKKIYG